MSKKIVYQIEVKEGDHGKQFLTIVRGKLGETYSMDDEVMQKVQDFIAKNLSAQLEVWGFHFVELKTMKKPRGYTPNTVVAACELSASALSESEKDCEKSPDGYHYFVCKYCGLG